MPELDLAINNATVVTPAGALPVSLGIANGRIRTLSAEPLEAGDTLDARGKIVLPGAIDPHVHFRMYQRDVVTSDDYATGSISAGRRGEANYIDFEVQPNRGPGVGW